MRWWRRTRRRQRVDGPVDCAEVARVVQSYIDHELDGDVDCITAHLDACRRCGLEAATYERIRTALAAPAAIDIDADTIARLRSFAASLGTNPSEPAS